MNKRRSSNLRQSLGMPLIVGTGFSLDQEAVGVKLGSALVNTMGAEQKKRLTYTRNSGSQGGRPLSSYQTSARQSQLGAGRQPQLSAGRQSQLGAGRQSQLGAGRQSQIALGRPSLTGAGRQSYKGPSRPSTGRYSTGRLAVSCS